MIETKDIKKMVAHIVRRNKGIADTNIMHPTREWFTGLALATLIVVLGSWFCWYIYSTQKVKMQEELFIQETAVPYNAAAIKNALELFETKEKTFKKIIDEKKSVVQTKRESTASSTPEVIPQDPVREEPAISIDPPPAFKDDGTPIEAVLAP